MTPTITPDYAASIGRRAVIRSRHKTRHNGRTCLIAAVERHGRAPYYRVHRVEGLNPATSLLYRVEDLAI